MIEQIVQAITSGGELDFESPELAASLEDLEFRKNMLMAVGEVMGFADQIDFDHPQAQEVVASADSAKEFLNNMMGMAAMAEAMDEPLQAADGPVETVANHVPAPRSVTADELDAALETVARSFYIDNAFSGRASITGDLFALPNAEQAEINVEWQGTAPSDPDDPFAGARVSQGEFEERVNLPNEDDEPSELKGHATITVPVQFDSAKLESGEVGQMKPLGSASVTLTRCENDCATLEIEGLTGGAPIIIARDAEGVRLGSTESTSMRRDSFKNDTRYTGTVAAIEVYLPTESATRELDIAATKEPEWNGEKYGEAKSSRYEKEDPVAKFVSMSADELDSIEVIAGRVTASFEFNRPNIQAKLPRVDNSHLAVIEFEDVQPFDESGNPMQDIEFTRNGYDKHKHCAPGTFEDYSGENPVPLSRATGKVRIDYPLAIEMITLTKDVPAKDGYEVEFDGPMVKITMPEDMGGGGEDSPFDWYWTASSSLFDAIPRIRVADETGRPLKQLNYSGSSGHTRYLGYWGNPTEVRLLRVTAWQR